MTWAALERQHALVEAITKDLVAARRRCGLTQAQLSEISDVAPWHVSETESSYIILDPNRLDRLCSLEKAFAIDLRWRDRLHELIQSSQDDHHYRIGQEVRAWRRRHKLHRTPAADRLGIQVPNLLSIEDGDLPDEALIPALSVAVGIDLGRERIAYRDPWGTTQGASTGAPRAITDHEHTGPVQGAETGAPQDTNREEEPMPGERQHDEPTWLAESVRIGARVQEARHGAGLSRSELAAMAGLSEGDVAAVEIGRALDPQCAYEEHVRSMEFILGARLLDGPRPEFRQLTKSAPAAGDANGGGGGGPLRIGAGPDDGLRDALLVLRLVLDGGGMFLRPHWRALMRAARDVLARADDEGLLEMQP